MPLPAKSSSSSRGGPGAEGIAADRAASPAAGRLMNAAIARTRSFLWAEHRILLRGYPHFSKVGGHLQVFSSDPESQPFMIAVAPPPPGPTEIAPAGQFVAQDPHSMQRSLSRIRAFPRATAKTRCGHTCSHMPHPVQAASENRKEATPPRYRKPSIAIPLPPGYQRRNAPPTQKIPASAVSAACTGRARRISFSTPDGEVKGVAPVKFMATNEEITGSANNRGRARSAPGASRYSTAEHTA